MNKHSVVSRGKYLPGKRTKLSWQLALMRSAIKGNIYMS